MTLPCETTDVHYADSESLIGSGGTLYLSFTTSPHCLHEFVANHSKMKGPVAMTGGDSAFPYEMRQERFGWLFDSARTYNVYDGSIDAENTITMVEDFSAEHTVAHVVIDHA